MNTSDAARPFLILVAALVTIGALTGCALRKGPAPEPDYEAAFAAMNREAPSGGSIFASYQSGALIEDPKAQNVGDVLTVLLVESTNASKQASTTTKKETVVENANPDVFGRPITHNGNPLLSGSIEGDQSFTGNGASSQSNSLAGTITVTVVKRFENGNLLVSGRKQIALNQGSEHVTISGIVRPLDISTSNTVTSDRLAMAKISYGGRGPVNDASSMGFLARFFNSPWALF